MSDFIVSARKYRPSTFSSVVGQSHITSTLRNAIERGQLAHAYLFCGPRGVGKTTCARIFAKAINCLNPVGAEACNECESCRAFNEGRSLNIHELDAASNNSVEDIRTLIEQVRIIPQIGQYSVFIIDEVHMLSSAAFNAFLKTLEEPPQHAIFILATTEKHKILPTILSRCQIYDFNRIRVEDGVGYLREIAQKEGIIADEESLNLIAQKADGGMRDALSMFDKAVSFCGTELSYKEVARTLNVLDYDTYFDMTTMLTEGRYIEALVLFDQVLARGFSDQIFMAGLNRHLRDLLMAQHPNTLKLIEMTGTLMERYRAQALACQVEFLFGAISILTELDGKIRQSFNRRLLVELGLMKIAGLGQKKNEGIGSISAPLTDLKRATQGATQGTAQQVASQKAGQETAQQTEAKATVVQGTIHEQASQEGTSQAIPQATSPVAEKSDALSSQADRGAQTSPSETVSTHTASFGSYGTISASTSSKHSPLSIPSITEMEASTELTVAKQPTANPTTPPHPEAVQGSGSIFGASLSELIAEAKEQSAAPVQSQAKDALAPVIDPDSQRKLEDARKPLVDLVKARRPRFVAAFELMKFEGNTISISVPTQELYEEIMRTRTSMLRQFAAIAGIKGCIELKVVVNEQIRASRPIKLEDRLKYIVDKNPAVKDLCQALDLIAE